MASLHLPGGRSSAKNSALKCTWSLWHSISECVADGAPELVAICHFTTRRTGTVLRTRQGHWEAAVPQALA